MSQSKRDMGCCAKQEASRRRTSRPLPSARALPSRRAALGASWKAVMYPKQRSATTPTSGADSADTAPSKQRSERVDRRAQAGGHHLNRRHSHGVSLQPRCR